MKYKACEKCAQTVGTVNVIGNILMILIKGYLGVVGGSKGLIADAIHSSADLLATIVMILGLKISARKKDDDYPYGYGKAEYLVAIVIYLFLLVIGFYILYDGSMAILEGRRVTPCLSAAWGAIFSIAINELMFRQSVCVGTQTNSPSIVAKAWESRSDVLSSIAVLVGILGAKMGFHFMDPLAAIAVGVIILRICVLMLKEAVLNLMDIVPESTIDEVKEVLDVMESISGVKDLHVREIGPELEFDISLYVPEHTSLTQGEKIKKEVKKAVSGIVDRRFTVKVGLYPDPAGA